MESLSLPANHNTQTKPRSVGGNTTTNLKSFRSVVLGKDGVGKSGILRFERQMSRSDVRAEHVCLCLKLSACRQTKLFYLTKKTPIMSILISIGVSHVSIRPVIPIQLVLNVPFRT